MNNQTSAPGYDFSGWDTRLKGRVEFVSRDEVLELAMRLSAPTPGHVVEFGVAGGGSLRCIRSHLTQHESSDQRVALLTKRVYGFDSFRGLPEPYEKASIGAFVCEQPTIDGVEIVAGFFEDTLTTELADSIGLISFAHFDADLYSSTLKALRWLTPMLRPGSLLLFDEFLGENEPERRAFEEWSVERGVATVMIAEFMREPAAWGARVDKRPLFQVL